MSTQDAHLTTSPKLRTRRQTFGTGETGGSVGNPQSRLFNAPLDCQSYSITNQGSGLLPRRHLGRCPMLLHFGPGHAQRVSWNLPRPQFQQCTVVLWKHKSHSSMMIDCRELITWSSSKARRPRGHA